MKRRVWTILCALISVVLCAFVFAACSGIGSGGSDDNNDNSNNDQPPIVDANDDKLYEEYAGVYYNDSNYSYSEEFIVLTEDKIWYDNTGMTGKYKLEEERTNSGYLYVNLRLYEDLTDNNVVYQNWRFSGSSSEMYINLDDGSRLFFKKSADSTPVPECPKALEYELSEDSEYYIIVGIGEASGDIVVPKRYRFTPVKEIADRAFYNNRALVGVEVPGAVTNIGEQAFAKCANLTSAKIEAQITELTEDFFGGCTKLVDVHIPKTVKEINYRAFKDCEKVQNVYYDGAASEWANIKFGISASHASGNVGSEEPYWANPISGEGRRLIINDSTVTSCELGDVSNGAFFQYKYLTSVSASSVGDYAFYNSSITSFAGSGDIGVSAFENCYMLLSLEVQSYNYPSIEYDIEDMAFCNCTQLVAVSLGNVRIVGQYAFAFCEKLTNITIPYHVAVIERYAFSESGLENVSFESIADWIIEQNNEQKYVSVCDDSSKAAVYLTDQITGYTAYDWIVSGIVFRLKNDGTYRVIPADSLYSNAIGGNIGKEGHRSPAHLDIPSTYNGKAVTEIYGRFDYYFYMLKSLFIPASVTTISDNLCVDILYCETASCPNGWDSWFNYHSNYRLQYPTVWNCKNNDKDQDGYVYTVIDNVMYRLKNSVAEVYRYMPSSKNEKSLIIPKYVMYKTDKYTVTGILESAFSTRGGCRGFLSNIVIPDGVTSIGSGAFSYCYGSVEMPNSVTDIEVSAFSCSACTINFHGTMEQWKSIKLDYDWDQGATIKIICENGQIEIR